MGRYAPVRSTPTSSFYLLAYRDFLQCTGTSHKLPVSFPVPFISECLLAIHYIRLQYVTLTDYVALIVLLSRKWIVSLALHPCANTSIKMLCVHSGTVALRICFVLCRLSTPNGCISERHSNIRWMGKYRGRKLKVGLVCQINQFHENQHHFLVAYLLSIVKIVD